MPKNHRKELVSYSGNQLHESLQLDVIFPVLHGTYGEDGTVQGLLKLSNIPFVGAGVLGSAIGMDKDVAKRLFTEAKLPISKYKVYKAHERDKISYSKIEHSLGMPCFVKPANAGSSVGVSKAYDEASLTKAVDTALLYDTKILIEEYIAGREVECSILGNEQPIASVPDDIEPVDTMTTSGCMASTSVASM